MSKTKRLVEEAKWFILHDKPEDFEELILQIMHETSNDNGFLPSDKHYSYYKKGCINWQYIYKEAYIYACKHQKTFYIEWLTELYKSFDTVSQIALRQLFAYGKYIP